MCADTLQQPSMTNAADLEDKIALLLLFFASSDTMDVAAFSCHSLYLEKIWHQSHSRLDLCWVLNGLIEDESL